MIVAMVYLALGLFGLSLGSFVNALVWRLHAQDEVMASKPKGVGKKLKQLSVVRGRSMCMHCQHELAPKDLIPVVSWLMLRGKCRYCGHKIDDSPIIELLLPILFVASYLVWPYETNGWSAGEITMFVAWLGILTGFVALAYYDIKWYLLPDRIVAPITILAVLLVVARAATYNDGMVLVDALAGAATIAGLFFGLWYISNEQWIGGGDVKLAPALGLLAGGPFLALFLIFLAAVLGTLAAIPLLLARNYSAKSMVPFGPFLIVATVIILLWGGQIMDWYTSPVL